MLFNHIIFPILAILVIVYFHLLQAILKRVYNLELVVKLSERSAANIRLKYTLQTNSHMTAL